MRALQLDVILSGSSKLLDGYLTSRVLEIDDALPGLKVTFAVYVEFNSTAKPHLIDTVVGQFLNRSDGEVGNSRIFVEKPFDDTLLVSDLDECRSWELSPRLHDCHENASCANEPEYFDCVCNLGFRDNSTDKDYLGRHCVVIDKKKALEALEKTFKTAGCSDGTCETSWDFVMVITSVVFSVLLLLLTVELIWRTRQLRREVVKREQRKSAAHKPSGQTSASQPLLASPSPPQPKHARTRKSPAHDNLRRPLVSADEDCGHTDSDFDKLP